MKEIGQDVLLTESDVLQLAMYLDSVGDGSLPVGMLPHLEKRLDVLQARLTNWEPTREPYELLALTILLNNTRSQLEGLKARA